MGLVANIIVVDIRMENKVFVCCEEKIYRYMKEYIASFIDALNWQLLLINIGYNEYNNDDMYVFIQTIPNILLENPGKHMAIINTEQMTLEENDARHLPLANIKKILSDPTAYLNIKRFDYSIENIRLCNDNMILLPYQYHINEITLLKKFIFETEKKYDVVFLGHLSPKRKKIYDDLVAKGINMLHVNGKWDNVRDQQISSAKILLNVHCFDSYSIYESIRCDRWTFAGMMVISEKSIYCDMLDINKLVIFQDYNKLVDIVVNVVNNYDQYYDKFMTEYQSCLNNIINKRKITCDFNIFYI